MAHSRRPMSVLALETLMFIIEPPALNLNLEHGLAVQYIEI